VTPERPAHVTRYVIQRLAWTVVVLFLISFVTFVIYVVMPANNTPYEAFTHGQRTARASELTKEAFGLDRPLAVQYGQFIKHLVLGDQYGWPGLGYSFQTRDALKPVLFSRAVVTAQLAVGALVLWMLMGVSLGVLAGSRPHSNIDRASRVFALIGVSTPAFLIGTAALYAFWFKLHLAPGTGYVPLHEGVVPWARQMMLPWITLAIAYAALYTRMGRATVMETMEEDYMQTARAKGLSERRVLVKHALRPSLAPLVTMLGMDLGHLLGGAIIVETVFNLPGLGAYAVTALGQADLPALLALTLVIAVAVCLLNLCVDLLYAAIDPRVRLV
jgi:peptide/nickel transport system permease protein